MSWWPSLVIFISFLNVRRIIFKPNYYFACKEHICSESQATERPCTQAWPREHWGFEGLHCPRHKRGLGGTKARMTFQNKPLLWPVFHHWVEYNLPGGSFQTLVLWSLREGHHALLALSCYFPEKTPTGAGVPSMTTIYFSRKNLPVSSFV